MPVPVLEEVSTGAQGAGVTSVSVDYDTLTTINADDILIIIACARVFTNTAQYDDSTLKPSGYTLINHVGSETSACHTAAWYKIATGSETGTLAVPNNDSADVRAAIVRISGADVSTVIDTLGVDYEGGNATSHSITGHTTGSANSLAIYVGGFDVGTPSSVAGSWTESGDFGSAGQRPGLAVGYLDMATAGATGTADMTISASQGLAGFTFSVLEVSAGGYTLTADSGSFALSGTANALVHGRSMAADTGTFSLSGTDATLAGGNSLSADSGTFSLSGTDVGLAYVSGLTAESGTFTLSGTDATLAGGFYMFAEMGAVVMTADDVTFSTGIRLSADSGTYTLTGTDVDFSRAYNPLAADTASYALTGTDVALYWQHALPAESGAYSLIGPDASISSTGAYGLTAESGLYALTGASVTFGLGLGLAAESGTYQISGADADLLTGLGAIGSLPTGPLRQGQYRSDQAGRTTTNT